MKNEISDSDEGGETRVGSALPLLEYRPLRRTVSPLFYVISHMRGLFPSYSVPGSRDYA